VGSWARNLSPLAFLGLIQPEPEDAAVPLICAACAAVSPPDADGWRAYLTDDSEAVMFCPECVAREFES
jgi:hypothetical protein